MANKKKKKQTRQQLYQGWVDRSPNNAVRVWKKDKKPLIATRTAAREYIDYDYVRNLSKNDKKWLEQFTEEYYFNIFKPEKEHIHSDEYRKQLSLETERRRRAYELVDSQPMDLVEKTKTLSPEDAIINYIDSQKYKN